MSVIQFSIEDQECRVVVDDWSNGFSFRPGSLLEELLCQSVEPTVNWKAIPAY